MLIALLDLYELETELVQGMTTAVTVTKVANDLNVQGNNSVEISGEDSLSNEIDTKNLISSVS